MADDDKNGGDRIKVEQELKRLEEVRREADLELEERRSRERERQRAREQRDDG